MVISQFLFSLADDFSIDLVNNSNCFFFHLFSYFACCSMHSIGAHIQHVQWVRERSGRIHADNSRATKSMKFILMIIVKVILLFNWCIIAPMDDGTKSIVILLLYTNWGHCQPHRPMIYIRKSSFHSKTTIHFHGMVSLSFWLSCVYSQCLFTDNLQQQQQNFHYKRWLRMLR